MTGPADKPRAPAGPSGTRHATGPSLDETTVSSTPVTADLSVTVQSDLSFLLSVDDSALVSTRPRRAMPTARLADRYDVLRLLGEGGIGSVYLVRDNELDEQVALKFVHHTLLSEPGVLTRFRSEVKLARRVTHENVARTYDIGEHQGERFLTMEYVDGEPLSAVLLREGALSPQRVIALGTALCAGLAAAHRAGVVHRDLKPANVLVTDGGRGRVVITDFGIAQPVGLRDADVIAGTAAYMAPEQVLGRPDLDGRADLYALGAVLFEALTGRVAWPGNSFLTVAHARLSEPPPDPRALVPSLPDSLAEVVLRCMARDPEGRFPRAEAVAEALAAVEHVSPTVSAQLVLSARARAARVAPLPAAGDRVVAVLPLHNAGPPEDDDLADEFTDELTDRLSRTRGVRVRPRRTLARATGMTDLRMIGAAVEAQVLIEGTLRRRGEGIRLTARALSVRDDLQLWSQRFERPAREVFNLAEDVVRAVVGVLDAHAAAASRTDLSTPAVELLLHGRRLLRERWGGFGDLHEVVRLFEQGLELAPDDVGMMSSYAIAVARCRNYASLSSDTPPDAARAWALAERAMSREPEQGDPWLCRAALWMAESDFSGAARALRRTLHLEPGVRIASEMLASIEVEVGLDEEGIERYESVLADEANPDTRFTLAVRYGLRGRWDRVDALLDRPLGDASRVTRATSAARLNLYRGAPVTPIAPADLQGPSPQARVARLYDAALRHGALLDEFDAMRALADVTRPGTRFRPLLLQVLTELLAHVGRHAEAMTTLAQAVDSALFDLVWLDRCAPLAPLRARPEWAALREAVADRCAPVCAALTAPLGDLGPA